MDQRRMHRAKHRQALRRLQQAGGPGDGLQRFALIVGIAAIALPAADRQHELDARRIRHAGKAQAIVPVAAPALGNLGDGATGRTVGTEQAELQVVAAVKRETVVHAHWKCGATCSMNRAISSLTCAWGFSPTLKYRITSSTPAAATRCRVSLI